MVTLHDALRLATDVAHDADQFLKVVGVIALPDTSRAEVLVVDERRPGAAAHRVPVALDNDSIPSDITPDRTISTPSRVQKAFGLVTQRAMPRTDVRLLPLSFLPSHVHDRVDY